MPRFGTKSLLIAFAVAALWFSTFAGGPATADIRESILLVPFLVSAIGALFCRGSQRVFWAGFFATMLTLGCRPLLDAFPNYAPEFSSASSFAKRIGAYLNVQENVRSGIFATIRLVWVLMLSTVVGLSSAYIYERSREQSD
jgi:hypothetical protein